ncbi:hypothetical protein SOM55_12380 [Pseudomonas coleopterorum]|uniref:hypothetical protein n=1 Tax=Pseudomonas coleopterorum TaxID=1605838 RepID=UPI002A6B86E1|nr:hypothetical protein [Pseudomonas coleopterorum]MDY1047593.1 hypothetical protein [Pseudomonas coleopterorum]
MMLSPGVFIFATLLYGLLTYISKLIIHKKSSLHPPKALEWIKGNELFLIISPDLWWAFRFKNRICSIDTNTTTDNLKNFVIINNHFNLWLSIVFCALTLSFVSAYPLSYLSTLLLCLAMTRFLSRSIEITYAFVKDAFQQSSAKSATALKSGERIKLAAKSYVEIYFYSAPAYLILTRCCDPWAAASLSLNVGTLTNVGLAFSESYKTPEANLVFFQVFTTLSLVVFSLAMYLARNEDK